MPYCIRFDRQARDDLKRLRKGDQVAVLDAIALFLAHDPTREQGSRGAALEQPAISGFRLRVGEMRVYYDVDDGASEVYVLRVRVKGRHTTAEVTEDAGR